MYYLLLLAAVTGYAANFGLNKAYQLRVPADLTPALLKGCIMAVLASPLLWALSGFRHDFNGFTLLLSALLAVASVISVCVCFAGYVNGSIAIFTLFQMAGGMLLPFIYGVFYGNRVSVWNVIGIVLMLFSLVLPMLSRSDGQHKFTPRFAALCAAVFLINGTISILTYIYSNSPQTQGSFPFMLCRSLLIIPLCLLCLGFLRLKPRKVAPADRPAARLSGRALWILIALLVAMTLVENGAFVLQLFATPHLPAVVLYPMVTGGTVVLTALVGRLAFREKISRLSTVGIVLTCLSTLLFLF